ncbi:uncharacterized protein LOC142326199 [Lycorma delicatula]|uniref:uncharacterized protein LOC142326199 n=1 Tax=Lycorma delicatula TaxID=130591 RepID=UPI003F50F09C
MAVPLCCRRLNSYIRKRTYQHYSTGYVVLLPEIAPNGSGYSPLLKDGIPDFSDITSEKCINTLGKNLLDFEYEVINISNRLEKTENEEAEGEKEEYNNSFINKVVLPLQRPCISLETTWGIVKTIFFADNDKLHGNRYLSLHSRAHRAQYSRFNSQPIYKASKECDIKQLSEEEHRVVERYQLEGNLNGLGLSKDDREILENLNNNLYAEKDNYNNRIQVSKGLFSIKVFDPYITRSLPNSLIQNTAENSDDPSLGPWIVPVDRSISDKFLEYCPDHKLRNKLWCYRNKVASPVLEDSALQNSTSLEKIRLLRAQQAELLGYPNYASMSMETKMAGSLENTLAVLESLRQSAWPVYLKEIEQLQEFADKNGFNQKLQISDIPYWSRKQKKVLYNFENEELREYFPFDKVFSGLLQLCERLFGIHIKPVEAANTWHPDVKLYYIFENDSPGPVAGFYFDPFPRPEKLKSDGEDGWIINIRPAHQIDGPRPIPFSAVVLNLPPPIYGKPSLLSYSEVKSLFGKFGRLLQQILCTVTYSEVSGLSYVEWDTVGITSHFMQHCLEEPKVLESISGHYGTGDKLPVTNMKDVSSHMAASALLYELYKSVLDLKLYSESRFWNDIVKELWPQFFNFPLDLEYFEPLSMPEIVTGEWCAGYYSHIWSRMIAADAYTAFNDEGVDDTVVGTRFRDTYFAFGGSCDPHEIFRRFRGRDPSPQAFVRYLKLNELKTT